jgi:hypothetical protein
VWQVPVAVAVAPKEAETRTPMASKRQTVPHDVVVQILTAIHGSDGTKEALVAGLSDKYAAVSKTWLRGILATAVVKEKRDGGGAGEPARSRWYVRDEVLKEHGIPVSPRPAPAPAPASGPAPSPAQPTLQAFFQGAASAAKKPKRMDNGRASPSSAPPPYGSAYPTPRSHDIAYHAC